MAGDLVKVSVSDVRVAVAAGPGMEAGMVTLREDESPHRSVPIIIGQPEARAIQGAWSGASHARPTTWDLFVNALAAVGARVEKAVINDVEENRHFFACIEIEVGGEQRVLPARPSDAIALALRTLGAEIYVGQPVMDKLGLSGGDTD